MPGALDVSLLDAALVRAFGDGVHVDGAPRRVSGGASRETWLFDAIDRDGAAHALVLRRDPAANTSGTTARSTEFALLAAAFDCGVPVPRVVLLLDAGDGLGEGFVMERVDGETIPRKILRDDAYAAARERFAAQAGAIAARIHAVPVATLPRLDVADGPAQVAQWRAWLDGFGDPHPAFELGLRWLDAHAPPPCDEPRLVHGDFRNGNFIVGPDGIRAVLDWELAHVGDPIEDLGWLCVRAWRFGNTADVVGGLGAVTTLLDAYAAAGGTPPTGDELRWWVALGTLKWGVMCMIQASAHLAGHVRSVELAAIGRRVAENEHDLLVLLDGGW